MKEIKIEKIAKNLYRWQVWIGGELDNQGFAETKTKAKREARTS